MHRPVVVSGGSYLEAYAVARHRYKVVVPHKACNSLTLHEAGMLVLVGLRLGAVLLFLVEADRLPGLREAGTYEKDVAMLELNVAISGDLLDFLQSNGSAIHSVGFLAFLLNVRDIIDEHSSGRNAFLCPVSDANPVTLAISDLI